MRDKSKEILNIVANHINNVIRESGKVMIVSHENPDGDAIGSAIALAILLRKMGRQAVIWLPGRFPSYYRWMKSAGDIRYYTENQLEFDAELKLTETLFAVDISSLGRTGKMSDQLMEFKGKKVLIDHHIEPSHKEFHHLFSDVTVSSTSELLYHLIDMMDLTDLIDEAMAEALYVGIMTDTGSFSFNCNSPVTYEVTAKLIHKGISPEKIHKLVYDNNNENRIRLLGYALSKLKVMKEFSVAYISLDRDELIQNKSQPGDTEGIVNFALSVKGVVMAAFFSFRDGEIKVSFRSKGSFSVNDFARSHFNGGGHRNAAGGSFNGTLQDATALFESVLPEYLQELKQRNDGY